jgi:indolepyruvate ferredoxin oxidoreductase beta subunit
VLIGTVGGQGGGVLSDWLVRGLLNAGWQATSIGLLGLSQRAGTVTYYCEAMPQRERRVVSSVFATPGDVDLILGQELLELGRLLYAGYAGPDCVIVGNSYRYLSTVEKMPAENGIYDPLIIARAVETLAPGRHYLFDANRLVVEAGLSALSSNAMILGAAVASPAFDLEHQPFLDAIRGSAAHASASASVAAFELGYRGVKDGTLPRMMVEGRQVRDWNELARQRMGRLAYAAQRERYQALLRQAQQRHSEAVLLVLAEALYRLIDYQDVRYAEDFLARLGERVEADGGNERLCVAYARNLAHWLTYEDAPRVAQLKTRAERFDRIARDFGVRGRRFVVTDYLVPDMEQILGMLPAVLARALQRAGTAVWPGFADASFPLRVRTSAPIGFALMKSVAALRHIRRASQRAREERAMIERWERAIDACRAGSAYLGYLAADAARVVKGYGRVRRRALDDLWAFLDEGLPLLHELARRGGDVEAVGARALALLATEAGARDACLAHLRKALETLDVGAKRAVAAA